MELEYVLPGEIEKRSFEIIGKELLEMGIEIPEDKAFLIKRNGFGAGGKTKSGKHGGKAEESANTALFGAPDPV